MVGSIITVGSAGTGEIETGVVGTEITFGTTGAGYGTGDCIV